MYFYSVSEQPTRFIDKLRFIRIGFIYKTAKWSYCSDQSCSSLPLHFSHTRDQMMLLHPPPPPKQTHTHTHRSSASWLHAYGSIQSDDFSVNHGILSQWCHQVGKLSRVSQARGEGHLAGKKRAHLLRKTSEERSGEETWEEEKENTRHILIRLQRPSDWAVSAE